MSQVTPPCFSCKNYLGNLKCQAFPKGIPADIKKGINPHIEPKNGQINDIVYEENNEI